MHEHVFAHFPNDAYIYRYNLMEEMYTYLLSSPSV